jgi:hypothetical protein
VGRAQEGLPLSLLRRLGPERRPGAAPVEFLCAPEDLGVLAPPVPARTAHPAWFKRLPGVDRDELSATNHGETVKRCAPFLDALDLGWLLPVAATVRLELSDEGAQVQAGWEIDHEMVSPHGAFQAAGNPWEPRPVLKLHNPWTIRTSPGVSVLVCPPLNRPGTPIQVLSGVVDTDTYHAPINLPFVCLEPDGVTVIAKGTPVAQVIPFVRGSRDGVVRAETEEEAAERERIRRSTLAGSGWYRRNARAARQ